MADSAPSLRALAIGHLRHALSQGSEHAHQAHSHSTASGLAMDTEAADADGIPPISSGISQLVAGITNGIASVLGSSEPASTPAPSAYSAALLGADDSSSRLDPEFQGLLWTLALDLVFFSLCFFAYTIMTKDAPKSSSSERRSLLAADRSVNGPDSSEPRHPVLADGEEGQATPLPPAPLLDRLFAAPNLPSNNGNLYVRFLQLALVLALSAGVLMMPVLLGLYISGGNKDGDPTWLQQASAGNLPLRSRALVVPFLFSLGFAAAAAAVLIYLRRDVLWTLPWTRASNAVRAGQSELSESLGSAVAERVSRTVHLQGLSWRVVDEAQLKRFVEGQLQAPDCVEEVHIVRDTQTLREVVAARRHVANGIDRATIIEARTGQPAGPERCCEGCCCCCKPGAPVLPALRAQRDALERAEVEARKEKPLGTGHAFLVFRGPNPPPLSRLHRLAGTYGSGPMNTEDWAFRMAPPPGDIIWDNLHITSGQQWVRIVFINLALFVLMVLIIAPVAVLQYIEPLLARVQEGLTKYNASTASVLLTKYAPTTVVFLINSLLLPWLIDISVDLERYHLFSQRATAVFRKNLFFMFLNSIAIPSLALNSIYSFLQLSYNQRWRDWRETIGFTFLSSSGYFFIQYAIHAALLGAGAQLIDLPQRIWRWWKLRKAVTPREIATANEVWEFDFGYWWAYRVTLFGVLALYAVIAPLVIPFSALFFFLTLVVDKHTLQQGFYSLRLHGVQLAGSAARFSWGYVVLLLLVMSAFFAVQGDWCFVPAGLLFVAALVLLSLLWCSPVMDIPTEPPEEAPAPAKDEPEVKRAPSDPAAVSMEEARPPAPSDGITDLNHDDWWEDGQRPPTGALMRQVPLSDLYTHPLLRSGGLGQPGLERQDHS